MIFDQLPWFFFSITATILFGISAAFYKFPSAKGLSKLTATFWVLFAQLAMALLLFFSYLRFPNPNVLLYAFLWGASYAVLTLMQMYALAHVETNSLFPVTTSLSLVVTVIVGLVLFKDTLSTLQILGIIFVIVTVYLFVYRKGHATYSPSLLWLGMFIVFCSAFNKVVQKFGADAGDIYNLQIYQYLFGAMIALVALLVVDRKHFSVMHFKQGAKPGLFIGAVAFLGGYCILLALTKGPFPLITTVHSLYIFVAAMVGFIMFKEKLDRRKIALIALAILALLLIRLG